MNNADYLRQLLRPLGVYDLNAPINGTALDVKGAALDDVQDWLEELGRESDLTAAQDWGLESWKGLFGMLPAARDAQHLRQAIQALLRIGFGNCTLAAVRDTLSGCGLTSQVEEVGTGVVQVNFPGTAGIPEQFNALKANIEEILPAHVEIQYIFNYLTWQTIERRGWTFGDIEGMTWEQLEKAI